MNKPKKPLRGLFASTEAPVSTPTRTPIPVPTPRRDIPQRPKTPNKPKTPPERLAPPPRIKPAVPMMIMESSTTTEEPTVTQVANYDSAESRVMAIQYNFESMRSVREGWLENDYAQFLKRLDHLQTEAFLLRGKLLSEAKVRFFETSKIGWATFCDSELGMNYTTANQYIRVSNEFDVTSHQRPDLGFEHFKAMLPLSIEDRAIFLEDSQTWSVKTIRNRVRELVKGKSSRQTSTTVKEAHRQSARFIRSLQAIKSDVAIHGESFQELSQTQRWQISAACQNIAAHLNQLARVMNEEPVIEPSLRTAHLRAGAFATVDGVEAMQEILPVLDTSDRSN